MLPNRVFFTQKIFPDKHFVYDRNFPGVVYICLREFASVAKFDSQRAKESLAGMRPQRVPIVRVHLAGNLHDGVRAAEGWKRAPFGDVDDGRRRLQLAEQRLEDPSDLQ